MTDRHLYGLRWFARTVLAIGVAVSVVANVLHAQPHPIARAIAAWAPLALLLVIELISRVPIHTRWKRHVRLGAVTGIAGIAAWVSYGHMLGVVSRYGGTGLTPFILPASVDGLIIVASISLVEVTARIRGRHPAPTTATAPAAVIAGAQMSASTAVPVLDHDATVPHPEGVLTPEPAPPGVEHDANDEASDNDNDNDNDSATDPGDGNDERDNHDGSQVTVAADLIPLLPAARAARDRLVHQGRTVSRDALAALLRSSGHAIRNNRVSELLSVLKHEQTSPINGRQRHNYDP